MKKTPFATAQVSSPQTPVGRKRKVAAEPVEKPTALRRMKSETELTAPSHTVKVATRRQERLRLDAEVVGEVRDQLTI